MKTPAPFEFDVSCCDDPTPAFDPIEGIEIVNGKHTQRYSLYCEACDATWTTVTLTYDHLPPSALAPAVPAPRECE